MNTNNIIFINCQQPTTNNQQPTTNNQQPTTNNQQIKTQLKSTTNNQQIKTQLKSTIVLLHNIINYLTDPQHQTNQILICIKLTIHLVLEKMFQKKCGV